MISSSTSKSRSMSLSRSMSFRRSMSIDDKYNGTNATDNNNKRYSRDYSSRSPSRHNIKYSLSSSSDRSYYRRHKYHSRSSFSSSRSVSSYNRYKSDRNNKYKTRDRYRRDYKRRSRSESRPHNRFRRSRTPVNRYRRRDKTPPRHNRRSITPPTRNRRERSPYSNRKFVSKHIKDTLFNKKLSRERTIKRDYRNDVVDRTKNTPFLVKVMADFGNGTEQNNEELHLYVWLDSTLRDLVTLVKDICPKAREMSGLWNFNIVKDGKVEEDVISVHCFKMNHRLDSKTLSSCKFTIGDSLQLSFKTKDIINDVNMD